MPLDYAQLAREAKETIAEFGGPATLTILSVGTGGSWSAPTQSQTTKSVIGVKLTQKVETEANDRGVPVTRSFTPAYIEAVTPSPKQGDTIKFPGDTNARPIDRVYDIRPLDVTVAHKLELGG